MLAPRTMRGRIHRRQVAAALPEPAAPPEPPCALCDRPIPPSQRDAHHWVPRSHGGRHTSWLHRICHRQIHALFTEGELARLYPTPEALRGHPQVARFVAWVAAKPPDFYERVRKSARVKGR